MNKETFKKILELQSEHYQKEQKLYKLGLDTVDFNTPLISVVELLWAEILTEEGLDWLSWFMFEKFWISGEPREDLKAYDGEVEIVKDIDGLYDYLISNSYFRAKNDINKEIKNTCHCGKAERENGEHYCKKCLNENPLLCN